MASNNPTPKETNEAKLDYKKIIPAFVIALIDLLGLTIIIPLLPLYATSYGASAALIGALGATYPVMQFIGAPILGRLSDRYGRRPVLLVSQVGTLLGFILLGVSNTLWLLFISRLIDGISGGNISTVQAIITDSTTEENRTQGLGLIGAAFGIGFIIGPVIAFVTLAASGDNYGMVAFVAAAFSFLSILLTFFWLEETLPPEKRGKSAKKEGANLKNMMAAIKKPTIGFLLILMAAQQFAFGGYEQLLSLFTLNRLGMDASANSALFVFAGVIIVAVQGYFVGKWSKKLGERWLILFGLVVLGLGLTLTSLTPHQPVPWYDRQALLQELDAPLLGETPPAENIQIELPDDGQTGWLGLGWLLVATFPAAVGGGILQPSINSLLTKEVSPDEVGSMLGLSTSFYSGANAITPLILGVIFDWLGSTAPFLIGGIILWLLWLIARKKIKITEQE